MRSRPELKVYLDPGEPTPGSRLRAEIVLVSRSETPINAVKVHLAGVEQRQSGTAMVGGAPIPQIESHRHVDLAGRTGAATLTPGEHRFAFTFDLPAGMPPRYRSQTASVDYDLHVRVDIPWWPDRSARYVVPVAAARSDAAGAPATFCTDDRGPVDTSLYVEASLETAVVPVGGVLRGAVSFTNVDRHRIRRVELLLVQGERDHRRSSLEEVQRYRVVLAEDAPPEGQPIPFQVALPPEAPASFSGVLFEVCWHLEIRAVITLGSDVVLYAPFQVIRPLAAPEGGAPRAPSPLPRVPPVGRERRALIWAESARRGGLVNDADAERMTLDLGAADLAITLEPRKAGGLALTATVTWPRLGIDLALAERRWVDAWSGGAVSIDAPGFADRFTARGREAAQVRAFLDAAACRWLILFDEAAVGDEGATLVSSSTAQSVEELDHFVARAVGAARAFVDATARVPPPAVMAPHLPAWRAFAAALGGRLVTGEMSIHDATFDESPLVLATEWSKEGAPVATVVRFPLPERDRGASRGAEPPGDREGATPPVLDGASRALVESLTPQLTSLDLGDGAVEARLPAPVADPATLEPVLTGLGRLARHLAGGAARGPYR